MSLKAPSPIEPKNGAKFFCLSKLNIKKSPISRYMISLIRSGLSLSSSRILWIANEANSGADNDAKLPKKDPIGVRFALRITDCDSG